MEGMTYAAKIVADSIAGTRLTSIEVTFPRFILAEFNTHRVFSRNSASSRAIPVEKRIAQVRSNPFVPEAFSKNRRGMQAEENIASQTAMTHLIELCAGTAAVSLAALGCSRFPVSRIGNKHGWVAPILDALAVRDVDAVTLVEADPRLAALLAALISTSDRDLMARAIEGALSEDSRVVWERARVGSAPVDTLVWMAGARGGIGGYKGAHKLRPNVDGFIPSRLSLVRRLRAFTAPMSGSVTVLCKDACAIDPRSFSPAAVYIDPPYAGRQGYRITLDEPVETLAVRWRDAGHRVVVSEARALSGADETHEITLLRRGQTRRSLTTNHAEWLSIYEARAKKP